MAYEQDSVEETVEDLDLDDSDGTTAEEDLDELIDELLGAQEELEVALLAEV